MFANSIVIAMGCTVLMLGCGGAPQEPHGFPSNGNPSGQMTGTPTTNSRLRSVETGEFSPDPTTITCWGQTPQGTTAWQQFGDDGMYLDVNTSHCGFGATPLYFTSLGGLSNHWLGTGATSIYSPSPAGFRVYVYFPGITTTQANAWGWQLNWQATQNYLHWPSLCAGQTPQGTTAWQQFGTDDIYLDVNTSSCTLYETPLYFTSLGGTANHWRSNGATAIYSPSPGGFRVFVHFPGITTAQANAWGWHLNWQASPNDLHAPSPPLCTGQTPQATTAWQQYGAAGIYLDVNTASCALGATRRYFTSLGGNGNHWRTFGATAVYSPSPAGFRVYVYSEGITATQANAWGWHLNWTAR
ncbi:hypothetical protein ACN469_36050 [Corallococcus terminator]